MSADSTSEGITSAAATTAMDARVLVSGLDAVEDGVAVFDANRRLVVCNAAFRALFPKIEDRLVAGTSVEAILAAGAAAGYTLNTAVGRKLRQTSPGFVSRSRGPFERQIADGRWLWIRDSVLPDGGFIMQRRDVTKRMAPDMRLDLIFDAPTQGTFDWYPSSWTLYFNRNWSNSLGYAPDENPIFHPSWPDHVHPDDRDATLEPVAETIAGRRDGFDVEYRFRRRDGSWAWIQSRGRTAERMAPGPAARRIVGRHADISRERESQIALQTALERVRTAEERLRTAIETIPEGFILFDPDRRLVCANAAYVALHPEMAAALRAGMTMEEVAVIGREIGFVDMSPGELLRSYGDIPGPGARPGTSGEIETRNGRWHSYTYGRTPDGGYVAMRTDVTDRKHQEYTLREALAKAEAASLAKTQFLANMSHELRTPLNAILGFSEIMRDAVMGPIPAIYASYAGDVHLSGTHLLKIINDILDLSKLTLWSFDLNEELTDPHKLMESCTTLIRPQIVQNGLSLVEEVPDPLPLVKVDMTRIKQVLLNLLSNAKKYTPAGGVITLSIEADRSGLLYRVRDTGIGMDPADIPVALEAFRQVGDLSARRQEGTGLGLPLAKAMVDAHGGTLSIVSAIGAGTTVTVKLPPERVIWQR